MNKIWIADFQILGAAFFFGIGFIGQRAVSVDGLGPMTCNALRFALSALLLVIVLPWIPNKWLTQSHSSGSSNNTESGINSSLEKEELIHHFPSNANNLTNPLPVIHNSHLLEEEDEIDDKDTRRDELKSSRGVDIFPKYLTNLLGIGNAQKSILFWGLFLGGINFLGSGLQQWGITLTSANKVAFIAGFDLFLTPIFSLIIPTFKRNGKPTPSTWLAVSISIMGLYFLSDADISDFTMGRGEILTFISTFFWTLHITYTDIATSYVDSLHMMTVQLTVVAFLSSLAAVAIEPQGWFWHHILMFVPWMLFLAVVEGLGFTLMAMGQNFSPPTHAAIILSLEGVFASVASYFCLGETLSYRELFGCSLMLVATYIAKMGCNSLEEYYAPAVVAAASTTGSVAVGTVVAAGDLLLTNVLPGGSGSGVGGEGDSSSSLVAVDGSIKGNLSGGQRMMLVWYRIKSCLYVPVTIAKDCLVTVIASIRYFLENLRPSSATSTSSSNSNSTAVSNGLPLISRETAALGYHNTSSHHISPNKGPSNGSSNTNNNHNSSMSSMFSSGSMMNKEKGIIKI